MDARIKEASAGTFKENLSTFYETLYHRYEEVPFAEKEEEQPTPVE